jgi:RND family efflux transporter MFP subunit
MRLTVKNIIFTTLFLVLGIGGYYAMRGKAEPAAQPLRGKEQSVKIVIAVKKSVPVYVNANGYVTAINTVDVHPRIQQIVRTVHVSEGQEVHAGQLLFTLDSRNDSSGVDKALAQVARDQADLADAEITLKRNLELLAKNFVSQAVVDSARNKVDSLKAGLQVDQAAAESTHISLDYNQISASINGRIGIINVHPGSLAQPAGLPMATITQLDPVSVSFSLPERELSSIRTTYPKGDAPVVAQLPGSIEFKGRLIFIDSSADQQSGTIRMKAQFANQNRQLWPGTFVNVRLMSRRLPDVVVLPAQAIVNGPNNQFVYVVEPDNTVRIQQVEVLEIDEGEAAITGVAVGARVVAEGTQNLRPGAKVKETQNDPANNGSGNKGVLEKDQPASNRQEIKSPS